MIHRHRCLRLLASDIDQLSLWIIVPPHRSHGHKNQIFGSKIAPNGRCGREFTTARQGNKHKWRRKNFEILSRSTAPKISCSYRLCRSITWYNHTKFHILNSDKYCKLWIDLKKCAGTLVSSYQVSSQSEWYCEMWIDLDVSTGTPPQCSLRQIEKSDAELLCGLMFLWFHKVSAQSHENCRLWIDLNIPIGALPQHLLEGNQTSGSTRLCGLMSRMILPSFSSIAWELKAVQLFKDFNRCPWKKIEKSSSRHRVDWWFVSSYRDSAQSDTNGRLIDLKISRGAPPERSLGGIEKSNAERLCALMTSIILPRFSPFI